MSKPKGYMPWRDEAVLDIIGDNVHYDNLERLKAEREASNETAEGTQDLSEATPEAQRKGRE